MKGDTSKSIEFLELYRPGGPWVLTAISTDKKSIQTATFRDGKAAADWVDGHNGKRNLYFHVNPVTHDLKVKANREDIAALEYLHVDVDPAAGADLAEEQAHLRQVMLDNRPPGVPPCTFVIFSGGGYQGFWKLERPLPIDGDVQKAEDAKRYNQQLERLFYADNCHNIDRIMRLPGTVNLPDARKLKKGRVAVIAELVQHNPDAVYPLGQFTPAPAVQVQGEGQGFHDAQVKLKGTAERLADINELDEWSVPDRVKVIIVQGSHPDERKVGDNSRSAWLFDVVCSLVRCDVPDEVIYSIISDPDFGISESVLDKGSSSEKYALRQIARAHEEAIDPALRELNEKHAVIGNVGGRCRIIEEVMDFGLNRPRITRQSFEDFSNRYRNRKVVVGYDKDGNPALMPLGRWWIDHPKRRQYETIVFAPGRELTDVYNLWRGFAFEAIPGDCSMYLEHIKTAVCRGDEALYMYVISWMAACVQNPAQAGQVALVLRGGRGVGKSVFAKVFGALFGRHFMQVSNPSHLVGNFNAHLRDTVVLFADEAFYAGDKRHASMLKTLVTEDTLSIEAKGVDVEMGPNYVHLIMASNDDHVVPAGENERRFCVLDVGTNHQQDTKYFGRMMNQMEAGGYQALLHYLMTLDIKGFQVRAVPQTRALQEQKLLSLPPEAEWWYQKLVTGMLLTRDDNWPDSVRKDELVDDYTNHTNRFAIRNRVNGTVLGKFLAKMVPGLRSTQRMASWEEMAGDGFMRQVHKRAYFWLLPDLETCRVRWVELYGHEDWPAVMTVPADQRPVDTPF